MPLSFIYVSQLEKRSRTRFIHGLEQTCLNCLVGLGKSIFKNQVAPVQGAQVYCFSTFRICVLCCKLPPKLVDGTQAFLYRSVTLNTRLVSLLISVEKPFTLLQIAWLGRILKVCFLEPAT